MKRPFLSMLVAAHVGGALLSWATPTQAGPSQAGPSPAPTSPDESITRAIALFDEGAEAFDEGRFEDAKRAFEESFRLRPSYDTAGLLGQTELKLGDYWSAATHIEYCLRHFPTGEDRALYAEIRSAFARAKEHVGAVRVSADRVGVAITIDGRELGTSPLDREVFVLPGEHTLHARTPDGQATEEQFRVARGEAITLDLAFGGGAAPLAVPSGRDAGAGAERRHDWLPAYVMGGVATAGLVTSVVFRGLASRDAGRMDDLQRALPAGACAQGSTAGECAALARAVDRYDTKAVVSNTSLVVGGAAAAATLGYVLYLLLDEPTPTPRLRATGGLDGAGGSIFLQGSF